jgi:hypothetical protein
MTTVIASLPAMTEMMFWPGFPPPKLARPAKGSGETGALHFVAMQSIRAICFSRRLKTR